MQPATAEKAPPRKAIDDAALAAVLEAERGEEEDDGLGPVGDPPVDPPADPPAEDDPPQDPPVEDDPPAGDPPSEDPPNEITQEEYDDPNSEYNIGVPGGRKPGDDGYVDPEASTEPPAGEGGTPPTPPAQLPGEGGEGGQGDPDPDPDEAESLSMIGDRELGLKVGGRKPDSATLHLKGGKVELTGPKGSQFNRGDRFLTVTTLQVTGDNDQDTIVKASGEVTSTSKKQGATLCGIARLEEWLANGIEDPKLRVDVFAALDLEIPDEFLPAEAA